MIQNAGIGVSYHGKKALNKAADIHFNKTSLLGLLYAQGYSDKEIVKLKSFILILVLQT